MSTSVARTMETQETVALFLGKSYMCLFHERQRDGSQLCKPQGGPGWTQAEPEDTSRDQSLPRVTIRVRTAVRARIKYEFRNWGCRRAPLFSHLHPGTESLRLPRVQLEVLRQVQSLRRRRQALLVRHRLPVRVESCVIHVGTGSGSRSGSGSGRRPDRYAADCSVSTVRQFVRPTWTVICESEASTRTFKVND